MRRQARLRTLAKWASIVLTGHVLLLAVATSPGRVVWSSEAGRFVLGIRRGTVVVVPAARPYDIEEQVDKVRSLPSLPPGAAGQTIIDNYRRKLRESMNDQARYQVDGFEPEHMRDPSMRWRIRWGIFATSLAPWGGFAFPLWPLVAGLSAATAGLWLPDAYNWWRAKLGRCRECGYDRRGLAADDKCPECGTAPAPASK